MHELALAEGIIDIIDAEQKKHGFSKVTGITLAVGEFSGIVPECIRDFFPIAAKGSAAENADIEISVIAAEFRCPDCSYEGGIDRKQACCPECGSTGIRMVRGREFYVENLIVD